MDFRAVQVASLRWLPRVRKTVPVSPPVSVQAPPSACDIALLPGRYALSLSLAGHPVHPEFVEFVRGVEEEARQAQPVEQAGVAWRECVDFGGLVPSMRLSAFDDAKFFDAGGSRVHDPTAFRACSCLLELSGAWVSDAACGLRWKVVEVKEARSVPVVPCFIS